MKLPKQTQLVVMMSIEFEAVLRNAIAFLTRTALVTHIPHENVQKKDSRLGCEILVTRRWSLLQNYCSTLGGHPNAERSALSDSCPDLNARSQGSEHFSGQTCSYCSLCREDRRPPLSGDAVPLPPFGNCRCAGAEIDSHGFA
jgi:hypothetical protein